MTFIDFTIFIIYKMFINNSLHTLILLVDPPSLDTLLIWRSIKVKKSDKYFSLFWMPRRRVGMRNAKSIWSGWSRWWSLFTPTHFQSLLVRFGTWPLRALLYRKPTFLPSPPKCVFEWFIIWSPKSLFFVLRPTPWPLKTFEIPPSIFYWLWYIREILELYQGITRKNFIEKFKIFEEKITNVLKTQNGLLQQ